MLFSTPTQFAALVLALVAGWLLGLASHPGGRKWKERYAAERDAHAAARRDADARLAEARNHVDTRATERDARIAELERENERLRRAAPVTAATVAPSRLAAARPAYPAREKRGWFDWGNRTPTNG